MTAGASPGATDPRLTALAAALPASVPFIGPEAQERTMGRPFAARLGANESVFGPSPAAVAAMEQAAAEAWMYGDPESHALRHALAASLGVPPATIMVGEGIDGLLGYLVRLVVAPGDRVVTSLGAYPTFDYHVLGHGGALVRVPYRDDREDLDALLAEAARTSAKLVYVANPDNPMGSHHGAAAVARAIARVPDGCLLVLDEAYGEFAPAGTLLPLDPEDPRVIRLRTFSKAHGLAGARVGYTIGPVPLVAAFDRVRNHFGMGRIAQAGALAALGDTAWIQTVRTAVERSREAIGRIAAEHGLAALPSATNFVALDCGADGTFARRVVVALAARGIFVRMPFAAPGDRCIRVTCGRPEDLRLFAAALPGALTQARAASGPRNDA